MSTERARLELDRLTKARPTSYAALSRMLGRNETYVQQYIKRGSPAVLEPGDRRMLANFFGVDEESLDGSGAAPRARSNMFVVPRLDVRASAGPGAVTGVEATLGHYGFDRDWLQRISGGRPQDLSIVKVSGDSMSPTLADGDDILVLHMVDGSRIRDGIYVLQRDDTLLVKRVALALASGRLAISSDNAAYPSWPDCDAREVNMVGRVVWSARKLV